MAEPLIDAERRALAGLRDEGHDRFLRADRWVRADLFDRGFVCLLGSRFGTHYGITRRGCEALAAAERG